MRIRGYDLTRAQLGWVCDVTFLVETINQCTPEEHTIRSGGRWFLSALWNARRDAKRWHDAMAATREQRAALGW